MMVLGVETTCDETAAAVVRLNAAGCGDVLSNVVLSQWEAHARFGGVVPEIAARAHVEAIGPVIAEAMSRAGVDCGALDAVAAAAGPGLIGGVLVGLTAAKGVALAAGRPLVAVNHLEAHALTARMIEPLEFPYLMFLASGGHTQLLAALAVGRYEKLGTTIDDAIGEAFDKVAKMLGLPAPGGPAVERCATAGNPARFAFPRPLLGRDKPDFSLSGLKTAVRIEAEALAPLRDGDIADLCASFQAAVADMVADRCRAALRVFAPRFGRPTALVVAGGVAANRTLRSVLREMAEAADLRLVAPPPALCTDNGAMIAWAGIEHARLGGFDGLDVAPRARWPLDEAHVSVGSGRLGPKA